MQEHLFNDSERVGQRLDNWLIRELKGVPKSRIYRALRKGEVRVNGKRVSAEYKLELNDRIRIPPLRMSELQTPAPLSTRWQSLEQRIIFENEGLIVIDKPSGLPVHGGTGLNAGVIEALRQLRPQQKFLELVHRLDRPTSGCLLIAKKRSFLTYIQRQFTDRTFKKTYLMVVEGRWSNSWVKVDLPLKKNTLRGGERMVEVDDEGKPAVTDFKVLRQGDDMSLLLAFPRTGRTHQLRVHAASKGCPIVGDEKYGAKKASRMMLHALAVDFKLPNEERMSFCSLWPKEFK